jgi:hypothetical protein
VVIWLILADLRTQVLASCTKTERTATRGFMGAPSTPTCLVCSMSHLIWVFKLCFKHGRGCLRCGLWWTNPCKQLEGLTLGLYPLRRSFPLLVNSWFRQSNGKVLVDHPLPAHQVKCVTYGAKSRLAHLGKVVHPCRVKSFWKVVSTIMDDLEMDAWS